jgi:hypothetical protein
MIRTKFTLTVLILTAIVAGGNRAHAQGRFEAEWLSWSRFDDADQTLIGGPGGLSAGDEGFGFDSGYRFTIGYGVGDYDIEIIAAEIGGWESTDGATLSAPLVFDDPTNAFIAPANFLGFSNGLTDAALLDIDEIDHLLPGAMARSRYESELRDFQLNLGTNRNNAPVWASIGWRHLELDEASRLLVSGEFQTIDTDDGAVPGGAGDGGDNALGGAFFTMAGFAGAGDGFAGFDPTAMPPTITTIGALFRGVADNDLDGAQLRFGGQYQPRDLLIIDGFLSLGLFQNQISGTISETVFGIENDTDVYTRRLTDSARVASFAGGLGVNFTVPVTDYIYLSAGYEGLIITNVALGPEQHKGLGTNLLGMPRYKVQTNGVLFAHGGNLGLGVTW